jgi:hypothetical protein
MLENIDQYIPVNSTFYKELKQHNDFLVQYSEKNNLPKITKLIGKGAMGYAFSTTDPKIILKITGLKSPPDSYEFKLFDYARQKPHPALCSVKATLKIGKFYLMWKGKLQYTTASNEEFPHLLALHQHDGTDMKILRKGARLLYEFGRLLKFKSNYFQREIDELSRQDKIILHKQALNKAAQLKSVPHFTHMAELLIQLLDEKMLIQDLTSSNLGINIVGDEPILSILDGMLLGLI